MQLSGGYRRAGLVLSLSSVLFFAYQGEVLSPWLAGVAEFTASTTFWLLKECGVEVSQSGPAITHADGFAYEISYRCTGFVPAACLAIAIFAYPSGWRRKLLGLAVTLPLLFLLNQGRLIHLFVLGVSSPRLFSAAHDLVWPATTIVVVAAIFLMWKRRIPAADGRE